MTSPDDSRKRARMRFNLLTSAVTGFPLSALTSPSDVPTFAKCYGKAIYIIFTLLV